MPAATTPAQPDPEREALLAKFRDQAQKLVDESDPEIRAIYKKRLLELAPKLVAVGVRAANLSEGNLGITVQDSDVRDVIQQIEIHVHAGVPPGDGTRGLRDSYLNALVMRLNRVRLIGGEEWTERVRLANLYTALTTDARRYPSTRSVITSDYQHEPEREREHPYR